MSARFVELAKIAKSVVAVVGAAAVYVTANPDIVPLPVEWRGTVATGCVALTGFAVWFKRNAPTVDAAAQDLDLGQVEAALAELAKITTPSAGSSPVAPQA